MMTAKAKDGSGRTLLARLISPLGFLAVAAVLAAVYWLLHLLGWREQVGFLSGNFPSGSGARWPLLQGVVYLLSYFAFVLAVPILVLAAGIFSVFSRLTRLRPRALAGPSRTAYTPAKE